MLPYFLILGPFPFFRNLALVFFGFYFLLNIIVYFINRDINWLKYILYIVDGFIVFFAIIYTIRLTILVMKNQGEAGFAYVIFLIMGVLIFFGLMGLFFTYCDTKP